MKLKEELIKSNQIFKGRIFDVYRDEVRLPDGTSATREIVRHPGAVAIVPLKGNMLVMVRQYRYAIGAETLEIPAGKLAPGEDPLSCAQRELREETGYRGKLSYLGKFYTSVGFADELMHLYLAEELVWDPLSADDDEFVQIEEIPWTDAVEMALNCQFVDAKTLAGILIAHGKR